MTRLLSLCLTLCLVLCLLGVAQAQKGGSTSSSRSSSSSSSSPSRSSGSSWGGGASSSRPSSSSWGGGASKSSGGSSSGGWLGGKSSTTTPAAPSSAPSSGWLFKRTPSAPSTGSVPSSTVPKAGSWGAASTSTQPLPTLSQTDRQALQKAKESGKLYGSRDEAASAFRKQNESDYRTSGFTAEPRVRPTYIPQTYSYNGAPRTIVYNNGGYGFWDGPTWRAYDFWADQMALNAALNSHGYVNSPYANQPQVIYAQPESGWSLLRFLVVMGVLVGIVALGFFIVNRMD